MVLQARSVTAPTVVSISLKTVSIATRNDGMISLLEGEVQRHRGDGNDGLVIKHYRFVDPLAHGIDRRLDQQGVAGDHACAGDPSIGANVDFQYDWTVYAFVLCLLRIDRLYLIHQEG